MLRIFIFCLLSMAIISTEAKKSKLLKLKDGSVYEGQVKHGVPNGEGTMIYPDGSQYTGMWFSGEKSGKGKLTYKNGDTFEGDFYNDKFKNGVAFKGVSKFTGDFSNNTIVKGSESTDHSFMSGDWVNGILFNGIYCLSIGNNYYNGEVKNGKFYGECCLNEISGTRIQHYVGLLDGKVPCSGIGEINASFIYEKKPKGLDTKLKVVYRDEITSEFTKYQAYQFYSEKIPKGLSYVDWRNYVFDVTGSMPQDLDVNEKAEALRKEILAKKQKEKENEEIENAKRRLDGINYIASKEEFEQIVAKPKFVGLENKWGIVEFGKSQMSFKKSDRSFDISFNDINKYTDFAEFFETKYQKVLTLNNEELAKYNRLLDGYVFTTTVPFSEYSPTVCALLGIDALMTTEVLIFALDKGNVVFGLHTAIDKDRIHSNTTRGKLLQQQLVANEYNRGTNTYDFQLSDDVFTFEEVYNINGKEKTETRHFKYDKKKNMLYDIDHKLYLEKKPISEYE